MSFTIRLIGVVSLVAFAWGCASRTVTATAERSERTEERILEPLARLPIAPPSDGTSASESSTEPLRQVASLFLFDIPFQFDQYGLRFDAMAKIEVNAMRLKEQDEKERDLLLEGRCDEFGTSEYNLVLGERRAHAVKQYLMDLGIPSAAIETISFGKDRPVCSDHNTECWAKNRTVHFVVR